jgi:hypothetical protein
MLSRITGPADRGCHPSAFFSSERHLYHFSFAVVEFQVRHITVATESKQNTRKLH